MKTRTIICIMILILSGIFLSPNNVDAKTYKFKNTVIDSKKYLTLVSTLAVNKNGEVQYIDYSSVKKNYNRMIFYTINKNLAKKTGSFKVKIKNYRFVNYTRIIDGKTLTFDEVDSGVIYIREYDVKGKCVNEFKTQEFPKRSKYFLYLTENIWDDGDNIYYLYQKHKKTGIYTPRYILCRVNKKTKKIYRKTIDVIGHHCIFDNGYIYELCEKEINIYSLKGKKLSTVNLPEGETDYKVNEGTQDYKNLSTHVLGVRGNFLYYCNKNGVYRCNIRNLDKTNKFKLIYEAGNDEFFGNDYKMEEICIKDKDTFFVKVVHTSDLDACADPDDTKFVKYTRKK